MSHCFCFNSKSSDMDGELDYSDVLYFTDEIVIERIEDVYLVISVQTANWIVLYNEQQVTLFEKLRVSKNVGQVLDYIETEDELSDLKVVLAAIFARKFAGVNQPVEKEFLEGYRMLNIYITNACNLRCRHCFMKSGVRLDGELSVSTWKTVLSDFRNAGGEIVTYSGGEPLMFKGFDVLLEYSHKIGLKNTVLSNGLLWDDELISRLGECIDEIQFSIDGVDESTNARVRGAGNFDKVVETVIKFANNGIRTSVATTFTEDNLSDDIRELYKKFIDEVKHRTAGRVFFKLSKKILPGREVHLDYDANMKYADKIKNISRYVDGNYDYENFMQGHTPNLVALNCGLGGMSISADGHVYYCNRILEMEDNGRITDKPFTYFMKKGREIHLKTSVDNVEPCSKCDLRYICDGGCRIDDFDFAGKFGNAQNGKYHQIKCTEEKKLNLKKRMIESFNYMYNFN